MNSEHPDIVKYKTMAVMYQLYYKRLVTEVWFLSFFMKEFNSWKQGLFTQ
jgi:hypothetical protein